MLINKNFNALTDDVLTSTSLLLKHYSIISKYYNKPILVYSNKHSQFNTKYFNFQFSLLFYTFDKHHKEI